MILVRRLAPASAVCVVLCALFVNAPSAQRSDVRLIPARSAGPRAASVSQGTALQQFRTRLGTRGELRLIVEVRTPARAGIEVVDPLQAMPDAAVAAEARRRVMRRLPARARWLREFETIPFFALSSDFATFEALRNDPDVVSIQEDSVVAPTLTQSVPLVQANHAWAQGYTGAGKTVAILDTGVQKTHSAFGSRVVSEACYSGGGDSLDSLCPGGALSSTASNSAAPCSSSLDGGACSHGTHVAGIAAGSNGVAKGASIIAIQVFSNLGGLVRAYDSDIIKGLERVYALRATYDIAAANLSLGGGQFFATCDSESPAMAAAIANLTSYRIATVVASGNDGYTNSMGFPACLSGAISVGNTTKSDVVASSSNAVSFLKLLAPGSSITAPVPGGGTGIKTGTSMAAPHVAGAWAILEHKTPGLKVSTGLSVLKNTGANIVDSRNGLTFRRIRINNALAQLTALPAAVTTTPSGASVASPTFTWNIVPASTHYRLVVRPSAGGATVVNAWHTAASVCGASTCSVTPLIALTNAVSYNWWIQTFDFGGGPLSSPRSFTPASSVPPPTTLIAPSGSASTAPTYQWNTIGSATSYAINVQKVLGGESVVNIQLPSSTVCLSTPCSYTPGSGLLVGTQYRWRVRTRNASGYGAWSAFTTFTPVALPPTPTPLSPDASIATLTPIYSWTSAAAGATMFQLAVEKTSGGAATIATYDSSICDGLTCGAQPSIPLIAGTEYRWRVRAGNAAGYPAAWSVYRVFTPAAGLPAAATLISPTGPQSNQLPTYKWNKVTAATRYYLTVRSSSGVVFSQNYLSSSVCGSTTCQVTPTTPLAVGSFTWRIQTHNASGYGGLSAAMAFSTVATKVSMVLTWGANPADLDSHLVTPGGYHVYHASKGSATSAPFATLDVDDLNGFGPETAFIHQAQPGAYTYYVRRYAGTGTLAGSGAQVKIYIGTTLAGTFTAPASGTGDYWHVCTITDAGNGARTCPNSIGTSAPAGASGFAPSQEPVKKAHTGMTSDGDEGPGDIASGRKAPAARTPGRRQVGTAKR